MTLGWGTKICGHAQLRYENVTRAGQTTSTTKQTEPHAPDMRNSTFFFPFSMPYHTSFCRSQHSMGHDRGHFGHDTKCTTLWDA